MPDQCERKSCEDDAGPDARYCPAHQREIITGLDECKAQDCDERVPFGSLWCEPHAKARASGDLDASGRRLDVPVAGSACRIPRCPSPALAKTIGKRAQGGWNDLCEKHYDEKRHAHAGTLAVARAAKADSGVSTPADREPEREAADPLAGEGLGSAPPSTTNGGSRDDAESPRSPTPEIREDGPTEDALREEVLDRVNGLPPIPTPELDGPTELIVPGAHPRQHGAPLVLEGSVIEGASLEELVLAAYADALRDALSALGAELCTGDSQYNRVALQESLEALLRCSPGIRVACELLGEISERFSA